MLRHKIPVPTVLVVVAACGADSTGPAEALDILLSAAPARNRDIFAMTSDGATIEQLTSHPADDLNARYHNLEFSLFVVNPDGTGLAQLADGPGDASQPRWSPDG